MQQDMRPVVVGHHFPVGLAHILLHWLFAVAPAGGCYGGSPEPALKSVMFMRTGRVCPAHP